MAVMHRMTEVMTVMYAVAGTDPKTGDSVTVELGWDADPAYERWVLDPTGIEPSDRSGYWFGVDSRTTFDLVSKTEIRSLSELVVRTRDYIEWTEQVYQAVRDLPARDYIQRNPNDPTTKILQAVM